MRLFSYQKYHRLISFRQRVHYSSQQWSSENIAKSYNASVTEETVRARWKGSSNKNLNNSKSFHEGDVFRIILPPPNVTGKLHIGHAFTVAIQDSIVRWKLMTGCGVKWIPGFDHAGIATQSVVLRKLQGKPEDLKKDVQPVAVGAEELMVKLGEFAEGNRRNISDQLGRLGALLDWDATYYTLDKSHTNVVEEAFITLFESGLIRRGNGIVNWCPTLRSSVADVECVPVDFEGKITLRVPGHKQLVEFGCLYFVNYKVEGALDESIQVATSRPETIFADVAIAVHPDDSRLSKFIGRSVRNPLNDQLIPVIADNRVKPDFGSGALKVTPAHDKTDFKIGTDHNLPMPNVFTEDGRMSESCGNLSGLGRFAARKAVIKILKERGSLVNVKDYQGSFDICSRTGDVIEPRILPHWFLMTQGLTQMIVASIESNELRIHPDYQRQNLLHKLAHAHDWCLSRQIQWGHKIPAYYHKDHPDVWVAAFSKENAQEKLEAKLSVKIENDSDILQDEDVLDTWFSSALIPLAVSNWPELDAKNFRELSLMETGADIVLFWVWRMAMMNLALAGQLPFRHVILHGIVTDPYGRKMSKSRGNVIDPLHVIEGRTFDELMKDAERSYNEGELDKNEYKLRITALKKDYPKGFSVCGTDALRFALLSQDIYKQDIKLDVVYLENCRHFMNKIWQAMRFYFSHLDKGINHPAEITKPDFNLVTTLADKWILACLYDFCHTMETNVPNCRFHVCVEAIREVFYQQFCDVYIELIKSELKEGIHAEIRILLMRYFLGTALKLSHPFLPYITEEMWQHITGGNGGLIMDAAYPNSDELSEFKNTKLRNVMDKGLKIVSEIRSLRNKVGVDRKSTIVAYIEGIPKDVNINTVLPVIESLSTSKVLLDPPSRSSRYNLVTNIVDVGSGQTLRVSAAKTTMPEPSSTHSPDPIRVFKLKIKLARLMEKLNNPEFLKSADDQSKEELKRKVEHIKTQINSISHPSSSTKNS